MIPLIRQFFHDLLWSKERVTLWFRSSLGFVFGALAQVVAVPVEVILAWTPREWATRAGIALILAAAFATKAGEKNPKPEQAP